MFFDIDAVEKKAGFMETRVSFKDLYPAMYLEYKKLCRENKFNPGSVFDYKYDKGHIYNLGTQLSWRSNAKIAYIQDSLVSMFDLAVLEKVEKIAMPAIGAGLGGLDWNIVKEVIETVSSRYSDVLLIVVEKYAKE